MDIFLQIWGGLFYLLAKVFLAIAEGKENSRWRICGWMIYLLGVIPWVIILMQNHNWIFMMVEIGGVPSMILGLILAIKNLNKNPWVWSDKLVQFIAWILVVIGIIYSVSREVIGFFQLLELGVSAGFLFGTALLYKKNPKGWLWFMLMNMSAAILMGLQEKWIFAFLQIISLLFVVYGFIKSRRI